MKVLKLIVNPAIKLAEDQMVILPAGQIALRDDRKKIQWTAQIKPFALSKYQVTQDLYLEVMQALPSSFAGRRRPVEEVSWNDAVQFCNLLSEKSGLKACYSSGDEAEKIVFDSQADGYRLPTDAEWEYACRAGTRDVRYGELSDIAWYGDNSAGKTHEVGLKAPNPWGLYDMLGNVWEWCWDIYDKKVYGPYRVFRGGGWADPERGCLASNRRRSHPTFAIDDLGFRVASSKQILLNTDQHLKTTIRREDLRPSFIIVNSTSFIPQSSNPCFGNEAQPGVASIR